MITKWKSFRAAQSKSIAFVKAFRRSGRLSEIAAVADQYRPSPLVAVFHEIHDEYQRQSGGRGTPPNPQALERAAQTASSESLTQMEAHMTWLATIAQGATYVGLFGTVMGIIDAFHGLGTAGAATLRAVASGISEALITTAAGLVVSCPRAGRLTTSSPPASASSEPAWTTSAASSSTPSKTPLSSPLRPPHQYPGEEPRRRTLPSVALYQQPRTHAERPRRHQHHAAGRRGPGAAAHLHAHSACASIRRRSRRPTHSLRQPTHRKSAPSSPSTKSQNVFLNQGGADKPVNIHALASLLSPAHEHHQKFVYVRADERVPFGAFASVMRTPSNKPASPTSASSPNPSPRSRGNDEEFTYPSFTQLASPHAAAGNWVTSGKLMRTFT